MDSPEENTRTPFQDRREFLRVAGMTLATAFPITNYNPVNSKPDVTPTPPYDPWNPISEKTLKEVFSAPRSLTAGGVQFQYFDFGNSVAPPLVLVHGFPDSPIAWKEVIKHFDLSARRMVLPFLRGYGKTSVLDPSLQGGQTAALAHDLLTLLDELKIDDFDLAGHDWGARTAYAAAILVPKRVRSLLALATPYLPWKGEMPPPAQAHGHWYQFYFQVEEAKKMLTEQREAFCKELWRTWCPEWHFTDEDFATAALAWDNPQFMPTVIDSYRQRWGGAVGLRAYADLEAKLDAKPKPKITVPTVYIQGGADACDLVDGAAGQEECFSAGYERIVLKGVGHFPHREDPIAVTKALKGLIAKTSPIE